MVTATTLFSYLLNVKYSSIEDYTLLLKWETCGNNIRLKKVLHGNIGNIDIEKGAKVL